MAASALDSLSQASLVFALSDPLVTRISLTATCMMVSRQEAIW
jgi:hypothetical protein